MAQKLLDVPDRLIWATNANRILAPSALTPPIDPAQGHDYDRRPHPRMMNYIHNLQGSWDDSFLKNYLANMQGYTAFGGSTCTAAGRNDATGRWIAAVGAATYYSYDGRTWIVGTAHGSAGLNRCVINTTSDGLIFADYSNLYYSTDGITWNTAGTGADKLANIDVGNFFLAVTVGSTSLEIWASGIAGGAAAPTSVSWTLGISAIAGDTANNWVIIDQPADCHLSTDAADNWTQSGEGPSDVFGGTPVVRDVDYKDGTIVAVGDNGSNAQIAYSQDSGATWALGDMHPVQPLASGVPLWSVKALGNKLWVAAGEIQTYYDPMIWYSIDDGENWQYAHLSKASSDDMNLIWCDGTRIMVVGDNGEIAMTPPIAEFTV